MAATRIMSIHINKGKTARQCIGERLDYIMNPKKTDGGILVSTYACSPEAAADEFIEQSDGANVFWGDDVAEYDRLRAYRVKRAPRDPDAYTLIYQTGHEG